jgi:hypothetical protein
VSTPFNLSEAETELARHCLKCSLDDALVKFAVHSHPDGDK